MKAKISPAYTSIAQKPYCCVPTCVQMILDRRRLPFFEQEEIGIDLGLVIPPEEAHNFQNVQVGESPAAGWGTRINLKKYDLNKFFRKNNLQLTSTYFSLGDIENVPRYITTNLSEGNDILICFRYGVLYNEDVTAGHGSLIEEVNNSLITLVDPNPDPERKIVHIDDLIESIKVHKKGNTNLGGFWLIQ
jgi:hypothetical protein